jgi:hypothetical protein
MEVGIFGLNMVLLKGKEGKKAKKQFAGCGSCHILSFVYNA